MLTRLLSTVVVLAVLMFGATVAMEAMGLIFRPAPADPQLRIEAVIARIEASLDPRNVPSEAEGLWPPAEERGRKPRYAAGVHGGEPPPSTAADGSAWAVRVIVETQPEKFHPGPGG